MRYCWAGMAGTVQPSTNHSYGDFTMLMQILINTPKWVFALFALLLWLGIKQMSARSVGLNRATILPLSMTVLSLLGVTSTFGSSPQAMLAWLAGAVLVFATGMQVLRTKRVQYNASNRTFTLPGSMVPLVLFMGIFFTKYVVGFSMAMQPALAQSADFALIVGAVYGSFSGIFLARAAVLLRVALRHNNTMTANTTAA
jgi:fucose 4-O-acetylase-like acetyltransferase